MNRYERIISKADAKRQSKALQAFENGEYLLTVKLSPRDKEQAQVMVVKPNGNFYGVSITADHWVCTCPDHVWGIRKKGEGICKHIVLGAMAALKQLGGTIPAPRRLEVA